MLGVEPSSIGYDRCASYHVDVLVAMTDSPTDRHGDPLMATQFEQLLARKLQDPRIKEAYDDACDRAVLQQHLTTLRREGGLTQAEVGKRMGVRQPTVSELENELEPDPRLSTVQRYARAVGARVSWSVAARDHRAHVGLFVSRTGSVDLDFRTTVTRWAGGQGEPIEWPTSKRTQFARCA